jgi:protein-disulfide isomerase
VAQPKQTKQQRIDQAREQARLAREQREKRQKLLRVLVPTLVSLGVLVIVGAIIAVIALQPKPAAAFPGGPKNLASDGLVYVAQDGKSAPAPTAALKKGQEPKATEWPENDGKAHIVTYIDWSCPACQQFEQTYADYIQKEVASGDATLEIKPIAILGEQNYPGGKEYSVRAANVAACVANYDVDDFLTVQTTIYDNQPSEGTAGLSNEKLIDLVHKAGVENDKIDACVRGQSFAKWVKAATERSKVTTTPTVLVNGQTWDRTDFPTFVEKAKG